VRVIKQSHLRRLAAKHPRSTPAVERWLAVTRHGQWRSLADARRVFPHADAVKAASGNTVTVFNIAGNDFRLITAIHYHTHLIFILRLLTHAEYSKDTWKQEL
jgi:mRNA interferase HigB